jgi:sugar/nucleoside kinase (ribokinase family)
VNAHAVPQAASAQAPAFVVLGHVTRDLLPDGHTRDGGTALFAAIAAQRLGLSVGVVSAAPTRPAALAQPITLLLAHAAVASTFENRYTQRGRRQWLHAVAPPLDLTLLPLSWRTAPLVHIGPVLHEIDLAAALDAFPQARVVVTPQGWMRRWEEPLPSIVMSTEWQPDAALLARLAALVVSVEDVAGDEAIVQHYARWCRCVVLTRGEQGATLYLDGTTHHVPTTPVAAPDPTGLGDVFAAALLIGLHERNDPVAAARFATTVAAATARGRGLDAIPWRRDLPPH